MSVAKRRRVAEGVMVEVDRIEAYDGSYDCLICYESVRIRGTSPNALHCSQCNSNPYHTLCANGSKWSTTCPQCFRTNSVMPWNGPGKAAVGTDVFTIDGEKMRVNDEVEEIEVHLVDDDDNEEVQWIEDEDDNEIQCIDV